MLQCRRCASFKLITLNKELPTDNDVFRCRECGYLFSPPAKPQIDQSSEQPQGQSPGRSSSYISGLQGATPPQTGRS